MDSPITWWPPKVGDTLRHFSVHGAGPGRVKRVAAKLHVLAVFDDKDGEQRIVTAEWLPTRRTWRHEIWEVDHAVVGMIVPAEHAPPAALRQRAGAGTSRVTAPQQRRKRSP